VPKWAFASGSAARCQKAPAKQPKEGMRVKKMRKKIKFVRKARIM
jgi:hypothetical protein